jgi:disulfide bond formation protein DsbB
MSAAEVADVEGTLATAGALFLVAVVVLRVAAPAWSEALRDALRGPAIAMAGVVALAATAGSLWFSEGAGFPPCKLCWYQCIAMYPLALLLLVAAARRDRSVRPHAFVLAGAGLVVSAWHNVIETFPSWEGGGGCDPTNPCTIRWVEGLGFWTIPRMALLSFALVLALLLLDHPTKEAP